MVGSGVCLMDTAYNIFDKILNKQEVSPLEIFQFSTSVLFFYKSTVSFKTAKSIITETQAETLAAYGNELRSDRHRYDLDFRHKELLH